MWCLITLVPSEPSISLVSSIVVGSSSLVVDSTGVGESATTLEALIKIN